MVVRLLTPKKLLYLTSLLLLAGLLLTAYSWWQAVRNNDLIRHPEKIDPHTTEAELLFAHAHYQAQQDMQTGIALYNQAANLARQQGKQKIQLDSQYNMGRLYLQQALAARQSSQPREGQQFLPLAELAQAEFRAVLRTDPGYYNARLSLEQTLSLLPEDNATTAGWKELRRSNYSHQAGAAGGGAIMRRGRTPCQTALYVAGFALSEPDIYPSGG
ncbi:MAG: hypothetical protein R3E89_14610 [Thiolinea sp.]